MADEMTRQEVVNFINFRLNTALDAMRKGINEDDLDLSLDLIQGMKGLVEIANCFPNDEDI